MRKKCKQKKNESWDICVCQSCDTLPEIKANEMDEHLKTVHGIDTKIQRFKKTLIMHLDAARYFETLYQCIEYRPNGVRYQRLVGQLRSPDDMMYR